MNDPLVSVIIPAYNRAHCLKRALDSIAVQGVENLEVLLGDDASSDDTIAVARTALPGIRVAPLARNSGAAAARNAAALLARGRFLAFLDSDDEWLPGKLQAQLDFLARHSDVGICACGHELVRQNGDVKTCYGRNPDDWPLSLSFSQSFHGASTPIIRHDVWRKVGPQDESLRVLEDWDWMLRASRTTNIHVLASPRVRVYENRPSDPDFTLLSTERFLAKHEATFADFPRQVHREIVSQHWENAGKNWILHGRYPGGCKLLLRSIRSAPWRNPRIFAAFPLALRDHVCGSQTLASIISDRKSG